MPADQIVDPTADESSIESEPPESPAAPPEARVVHFLEDGFTALGLTWYRGQELEITPAVYKETQDRNGDSWTDLDEAAQFERFGKIIFRPGPWPGKAWEDEQAAAKEKKRRRQVPAEARRED